MLSLEILQRSGLTLAQKTKGPAKSRPFCYQVELSVENPRVSTGVLQAGRAGTPQQGEAAAEGYEAASAE